jgi:hypothetical protein
MTEQRLQQEVFMYFHNHYPKHRGLFFRIKNEGTSKISGAIGKATGIVPGVSDMVLLVPPGKTLFLEFKTDTGRQSPAQREWEKTVTTAGFEYHIIRSLDRFKQLCDDKIKN